jgi:hypothetical protein
MRVERPTVDKLGALISTHPVARRPRWRSGLLGAVITLPGLLILVFSVIAPPSDELGSQKGVGSVVGLGLILVAVGFPLAAIQLTRAVRGGRREVFEIHEGGLVHRAWRTRCWTWDQVAAVRVRWDMDGTLWKRLGWNFRCWIRFADRSRVRVDGLAADGRRIAEAVVGRRPDAVVQGPAGAWRLLPPLLVLFFAGGLAGSLWYVTANGGERLVTRGGETRFEPIISDTVSGLLVIGMAISIIGLVFSSLITFVMFLRRSRS